MYTVGKFTLPVDEIVASNFMRWSGLAMQARTIELKFKKSFD